MGYDDDDDNDEQATTQRQGSRIPSASHREGPVSVGAARRPSKVPILESETLGVPKKEMSGRASPLGEGRPKGSPSPPVPESTGGRLGRGQSPCQQGDDHRSAMPGATSHKAGGSGIYSNGMLFPGPTQSDGEAGGALANFKYGRPRIFKTPMPTLQPSTTLTSGPRHFTELFGNDDSEEEDPWNSADIDPWRGGGKKLSTSPSGLFEGGSRALMKAAKGPLYHDHADGKPPVPKPVSGMSLDEFCSAFKTGAITAVSSSATKSPAENVFDISTPEDERVLAMHRELGIEGEDRRIPNSVEAELGIQEFVVSDFLSNAKAKDVPTISILGSYDYDSEKDVHSFVGAAPVTCVDLAPDDKMFLHWSRGDRSGKIRLPAEDTGGDEN